MGSSVSNCLVEQCQIMGRKLASLLPRSKENANGSRLATAHCTLAHDFAASSRLHQSLSRPWRALFASCTRTGSRPCWISPVRPKPTGGLDGISILPTLLGKKQEPRHFSIGNSMDMVASNPLRAGDWKLVKRKLLGTKKNRQIQPPNFFYHLATDPSEKRQASPQIPRSCNELEKIAAAQHSASGEFPFPTLDQKQSGDLPVAAGFLRHPSTGEHSPKQGGAEPEPPWSVVRRFKVVHLIPPSSHGHRQIK